MVFSTFARKFEFAAGLITCCLALTVVFLPFEPRPESFSERLWPLLVWGGSGALVGVGTYVHAVRRQRWGRALTLLGSAVLVFFLLWGSFFMGQLLYVFGLMGLAILAPGLGAVLTTIAAFRGNDSRK
jgi:hypothetical protein